MKARPVIMKADENTKGGTIVVVPLGAESRYSCKMDLPSWQRLLSLGWSNLNYLETPNGNVYATVPSRMRGVKLMVARLLTDAVKGEMVHFKNGDTLDLRADNLLKKPIKRK